MSDLAKQLGKRIYQFRKQNKLTQARLAEKVKISNEFMSGIERGAKLPSLFTLEKIATALGLKIKDLFNFDRASFRDVETISRATLDIAVLIERVPVEQRHQITQIVKILSRPMNS